MTTAAAATAQSANASIITSTQQQLLLQLHHHQTPSSGHSSVLDIMTLHASPGPSSASCYCSSCPSSPLTSLGSCIDSLKPCQSGLFNTIITEDNKKIKLAVKLDTIQASALRYLVIISSNLDETALLGINIRPNVNNGLSNNVNNSENNGFIHSHHNQQQLAPNIGLVLPIFSDTNITLDGDGGFRSVS